MSEYNISSNYSQISEHYTNSSKTHTNNKKQPTPREVAALFSCSYYDIMVKPILKIIQKNQAITTETDTIPFLKELLIKILTEWGILEPNHTQKINQMIENTINKTQWYKVETWSEAIREQAVLRLFKDTSMTNIKPTLKFIKHPQLIYIIPNTSKHIIDNILQSFDRYDQPKIEQKIQLKKTLAHLIIISESHMFAKPDLERQEDNDTQSILEHQLLFTLHTRLEIQKHFKEIEEAAEVNIQELIMTNKDRVKDQRKITDNIANYISYYKTIINQSQKEDWDFFETLIEE